MNDHGGATAHKACTKCGEVKPLEAFYARKTARDGRHSACKGCYCAARRAQYKANPDGVREKVRAWEKANREKVRAMKRAWYKANLDREREKVRAWREGNREKARASVRAWAQAHPEENRAAIRAWKAANLDAVRDVQARRRARKRNAPVVERIYRSRVWERDAGRCHICGKKADPNNWHLEHIIPLALGGEHSYRNVAVSHPACNLSKGVRGHAQLRLDVAS